MKILDPQSAVLTNPEVLSFMRAHPPRRPDPRVGGYPVTDLKGLWHVQSEFTDYVQNITPHLLSYPEPPSKYMRTLLERLHKFNLTKPEVLVMINLGVGLKKAPDAAQGAVAVQDEETTDAVENGDGDLLDKVERHLNTSESHGARQLGNGEHGNEEEQEDDTSDISVLNTIIEEMYERLGDADIKEILRVCGEVLGSDVPGKDEACARNG